MYRMITCKTCHSQNSEHDLFCESCRGPLYNKEYILEKLADRQTRLEENYSREINSLKEQMILLQQIFQEDSPEEILVEEEQVITIDNHYERNFLEEIQVEETPKEELLTKKEVLEQAFSSPAAPLPNAPVKKVPSEFEKWLVQFMEPFFDGISLLEKVYQKYKGEGKLPIFFMTIAGIAAILFGVGYLMQYTFDYLGKYAEVAKIGIGFIAAFSVGGIGIRLSLKDENSSEYGSALISLAIILNYLMIYFLSDLGNFPLLSSALFGFALIVANTASAVFIAAKFETKVVSVLFLAGGALAPFYLNSTSDGTLYYLYLWLLIVAANIISVSIGWKTLQHLAFVIGFTLLQVAVFQYSPSSILFTIYYHLYAYLFFYFILFKKSKLKKRLDKVDIALLAANTGLFLYNLYDANADNLIRLGFMYLANGAAFVFLVSHYWKTISSEIKLTLFIITGALVGFAIPSLFDEALMGLFWSIEGMLLVLLGFNFGLQNIRQEGYFVLFIAVAKLIISCAAIITHWQGALWHEGFLNLVVLSLLAGGIWIAGNKHKKKLTLFEQRLVLVCREIVPASLSLVLFLILRELFGIWSLNLSVLAVFGLVFWSKKFKTEFTIPLAFAHLLLLGIGYLYSSQTVFSYYFEDQTLYGKIAIIEAAFSLWFLKKYFELLKLEPNRNFGVASVFRIIFYLAIPLTIISFTRRHAVDYIETGMWISVFTAYLLHKKLSYKALFIEFGFLFSFAAAISFAGLDWLGYFAGLAVMSAILIVEKANIEEHINVSPYKIFLSIIPYIGFSYMGLLYASFTHNFALGASIFALLSFIYVLFKTQIVLAEATYKWGIFLASLFNFLGLTGFFFNSHEPALLSVINLSLFGVILVNKSNWFDMDKENANWKISFIFHQISTIATYLLILDLININISGPVVSIVLAIHAIILLFLSLKNEVKIFNTLSIILFAFTLIKVIFNDIRDFSAVEKVIVLIVLGILLLGAAYLYQKMKQRFRTK